MVPDRLIGATCLAVAALGLTWGSGPGTEDVVAAPGGPVTVKLDSGRAPPFSSTSAPASSTTTSPSPSSTTAPGATSTTRGSAAGPVPAEAASEDLGPLARRGIVVAADLPGGFVQVSPPPAGPDPADGPFERCLGPDAAALTAAVRAKARSGEFGKSGTGTLSSSSAVFDQPASAERVLGALRTPSARACFEGLINGRLARNPNLPEDIRGTLAATEAPELGDGAVAFRFSVMLPAEDVEDEPTAEEIPYLADFLFTRKGRTLVLFEFGNLRQAFPPSDASAIATTVLGRL